ncbi:SGNH/GDSL hydrolase family protein [Blastococcus mobilis]|uniref:Lysophospholipase L1 n=1 Tax=Blastococcus mobilis TaxID=1938746 RepID=A0A238VHJ3_9ACTN|nr:GDSL-type esterase/lipase family protein [Blastococcus mobilis]SNR32969.1 Lysophospholipase L1 [Blastococcus mobilis]
MAWYLSPSGWPQWADDGGLFAQRLTANGWQLIDASQVQAAIDAYNAATPAPVPADFVTVDELDDPTSPASLALRAASVLAVAEDLGDPGTDLGAIAKSFVPVTRGVRVAIHGESHAVGTSTNSPRALSPTEPLSWAHWLSGARFQYVWNGGVGTTSTAQHLTTLGTVLAADPDVVVYLAGTYDMNPTNGVPFTTYQANVKELVSRVRAAGALPVLGTVLPAAPNGTGAKGNTDAANAWLRTWCANVGVPLLETFTNLVDPATGLIQAALRDASGVHANAAGNKVLGQALADLLAPRLPLWTPPMAGYQTSESKNLVPNALFLTDGDANGKADSTSWTANATASLVAATAPALGNWQRMVSTDDAQAFFAMNLPATGTSTWQPGDRIAFCGRFLHEQGTSTKTLSIQLNFTGGTPNSVRPVAALSAGGTGVFYVEETIPAGTTAMSVNVIHNAGTLGTGLASQVGQLTVLDLTKLGAA